MANDSVARALAVAALNGGGGGEPEAYLKTASVNGNTLTITDKNDSQIVFSPEGEPELYLKNASVSGNVLTLTKEDDSTVTFTDTDTTYTAGNNVSISNNVISATDTTYTAGSGISITDGVISNTQTPGTVVSGTNDGTNWQTITIGGTTKNIPSGGSVEVDNKTIKTNSQGKLETQIGGWKEVINHPAVGDVVLTGWEYTGQDFDLTDDAKMTILLANLQKDSSVKYTTTVNYNNGSTATGQIFYTGNSQAEWQCYPPAQEDPLVNVMNQLLIKDSNNRMHIWDGNGSNVTSIESVTITIPAWNETIYHKVDSNYLPENTIPISQAVSGYEYLQPLSLLNHTDGTNYRTAGYYAGLYSEVPISANTMTHNDLPCVGISLLRDNSNLITDIYGRLSTAIDAGYDFNIIKENSTYTDDGTYYVFDQINSDVIDNLFDNNNYVPSSAGGQGDWLYINLRVDIWNSINLAALLSDSTTATETIRTFEFSDWLTITRTTNLTTQAKTYVVKQTKSSVPYPDRWTPGVRCEASTAHQPFSADFTPIDNNTITINADGKLQANSSGPSNYIKNASVSGSTLTLTKQDDSTVTFTDTDTTYSAGTGINISSNVVSYQGTTLWATYDSGTGTLSLSTTAP